MKTLNIAFIIGSRHLEMHELSQDSRERFRRPLVVEAVFARQRVSSHAL